MAGLETSALLWLRSAYYKSTKESSGGTLFLLTKTLLNLTSQYHLFHNNGYFYGLEHLWYYEPDSGHVDQLCVIL